MRDDIKRRIEQIRRGEVPEGYKRIGGRIFPESWSLNKIKDFAKTKSGKTPDRDRHSEFYQGGNLNWFKTGELLTKYLSNSEEKITPKALALCGMPVFPKRSIILAMYGATIGKASILDENSTTNQACCCIFPSSSYDTEYIFYQITFNREAFVKISAGAAQPNINQSLVQNFCLPLCETNEQNRIAEILSTCDRVIDLKKKLIEDKKKVKKWLMQTLLTGMIRVKDIENGIPYEELKKRIEQIRNGQVPEGYRKTELGIISHDWEITGLEKICKLIIDKRGKTPKQDSSDGDIPGLSAHNVRMGKIDFTFPTTYYSEDVFNRWMKNEKIEKEDIIMTTEAPLGNIALVEETRKYILGQRVVALRLKDSVNSIFGKHLLMSNIFQRKLQELATGTTAKGLSKRNLKYLKVYIPDTETQKAVSSILSTADTEIDLLNKDLEQWELKKKSLMQLLLTGIVRIKA